MASAVDLAARIVAGLRAPDTAYRLERPIFEAFTDVLVWLRSDDACYGVQWGANGDEALRQTAKRLLFARWRIDHAPSSAAEAAPT